MREPLRLRVGALAATALLTVAAPVAAGSGGALDPLQERDGIDLDDLEGMRYRHPGAAAALLAGEAALRANRLEEALKRFDEARKEAPESALAARRACQTLTLLGRRAQAIAACEAATTHGTALDARAMVAALMSAQPTTDELATALRLADLAERKMPDQPWGAAARCDIALRVRNVRMLDECRTELERVAPLHDETLRLQKLYRESRSPWLPLVACAAFAVATLGTGVHALRRATGKRRVARKVSAAAISLGAVLAAASPEARADEGAQEPIRAGGLSQWRVDDSNPAKSVPSPAQRDSNPVEYGYHLMDLADKADEAIKKNDFGAAARFYAAMAKAAPDVAIGFRKACDLFRQAKDREQALSYCAEALTKKGVTVADHVSYAAYILEHPGPVTERESTAVKGIIEHLRAQSQALPAAEVECQLGTRLEDGVLLRSCTAVLEKLAPKDPRTVSYSWASALQRGDLDEAGRLIERARTTAMKKDGIEAMVKATAAEATLGRRMQRHATILGWIMATVVTFGAALVLFKSARLKNARRPDMPAA